MNDERRQTMRVECCYQVEGRLSDEIFAASVVNMGMGGMRLLSERPLPRQASVRVDQKASHSGPVSVKVVWSRPEGSDPSAYLSGVVYDGGVEQLESSWVKLALRGLGFESLSQRERRRHIRSRAHVRARLCCGEQTLACQILDLGLGGALVECVQPSSARPGDRVVLEVDLAEGERLAASVIYVRARSLGLCFETDVANRARTRLIEGILQSMTTES